MLSIQDRITDSPRIRKLDRIIVLEPLDPEKFVRANNGMVDTRLMTGDNKLHAIADTQTMMWRLKYESGVLPIQLQGKFVGFGDLVKHVTAYFKTRNIKIKEILD